MVGINATQIGNRNKARGSLAERAVADHLNHEGYVVMRAAGSFGPADLTALKPGQTLLVQVKRESREGRRAHVKPADWNALLEVAIRAGALPIVAIKGFRKITLYRITGPKDRPRREPPWTPFRTDEVTR